MDDFVKNYRGFRFSLQVVDDARAHFIVTRIEDGNIMTSRLYEGNAVGRFEDLIDTWLSTKLGAVPAEPKHCANCETVLRPEFDKDTKYQFDNALWIKFSGGYGMFIDPMTDDDPEAVICHECAHKLCEQNPWIMKLLDPHNSHAHRVQDIPELLMRGHTGWDLDNHNK